MRQTGCFSQIRTIFGGLAAFFVAMAFGQTPGTLDLSFAGVGYVTTTIGTSPSDDRARAVVVQPDGKIVVAGTCDDDFCMVRYLVNGSLDGTFGTGGRVVQNLVGTDTAYAMVMQPDGKFVLAGHCVAGLTSTFCAARFTTAGALDQSFGGASSGFVTINVTSAGDVAKAVTLQTDGKIVMAGACTNLSPSTGQDFCLVRLNGDGTPDLTFNGTGKVFTTFGGGICRGMSPK